MDYLYKVVFALFFMLAIVGFVTWDTNTLFTGGCVGFLAVGASMLRGRVK